MQSESPRRPRVAFVTQSSEIVYVAIGFSSGGTRGEGGGTFSSRGRGTSCPLSIWFILSIFFAGAPGGTGGKFVGAHVPSAPPPRCYAPALERNGLIERVVRLIHYYRAGMTVTVVTLFCKQSRSQWKSFCMWHLTLELHYSKTLKIGPTVEFSV